MLIFLLFDLKAKIYYMTYEKVMGRPHPTVRKHRLLRLNTTSTEKRFQPQPQPQLSQEPQNQEDQLSLRNPVPTSDDPNISISSVDLEMEPKEVVEATTRSASSAKEVTPLSESENMRSKRSLSDRTNRKR